MRTVNQRRAIPAVRRGMRAESRQPLSSPIRQTRFAGVAIFFTFWVIVIVLRLCWLQIVEHTEYRVAAARQQQHGFEVAPRRGVFYDRNLRELAMTVSVDSVYAVPSEMGDQKAATAAALAKLVHTDPTESFTSEQQIAARINASRNFAWVARKQDAAVIEKIRALNLKGVYFQKEFKRYYPNAELAAQMLGYVGLDDKGLGGLEHQFDEEINGEPGHMLTAVDARRHVLGSEEHESMPGENLVLSIDANIQYMAEQALDRALVRTGASNGTVVVQDPHTGQILALAIRPTFNPNDSRHSDADLLKNRAVSDVYEPGSTFKLVTYSAALDAAGVEPTDIVDCQGGAITLFGRTIHDDASDRGMGKVTVARALEKSSDVAAVKMALKVGQERFYGYMRGFGFGDRSGIELPAETRGILRPTRRWGATSIGSLAIGQEVGVTPVQLVSMVSTIANGGVYLHPHVVIEGTEKVKGDPGLSGHSFHPATQLPSPLPEGAHRVISEMTAAKMRKMMEGIVLFGTGRAATLDGYSAGGKTGTAQKIDVATHTYSKTKHIASFAGIAPVNNPAVSIAVVIDSATKGNDHGAAVSAPVFKEVAQQVLEYLGVPHDVELQPNKTIAEKGKKDGMVNPTEQDEDGPSDRVEDLNAMFAEVNELPVDDPLRAAAPAPAPAAAQQAITTTNDTVKTSASAEGDHSSVLSSVWAATSRMPGVTAAPASLVPPPAIASPKSGVVVDAGNRVAVPQCVGQPMRKVIETAAGAGLGVQALGDGVARAQVPAAGTLVPVGTEIVVQFSRSQ